MNSKKLIPIVKSVSVFIICCLSALLLVGFFLSSVLSFSVFNKDYYRDIATEDSYLECIREDIDGILEYESLYYGIPFETLKTAVDDSIIRDASINFSDNMYSYLNSDYDLVLSDFCIDELKNVISEYYFSVGDKDTSLVDEVSESISSEISNAVYSSSIEELLYVLRSKLFNNFAIKTFKSLYAILPITALGLLSGAFYLMRGSVIKRIYNLSGVLFSVSSAVFAPVLVLKLYDLPSKIVLSRTAFSEFIFGAIYRATDVMFVISLILFVISALVLVASVCLICNKKHDGGII